METTRRWDVAPFIVVGVALGVLGQLLVGSSDGWAGLLSLAGFVLTVAGLVRWTHRGRRSADARTAAPQRVAA